MKKIIFLLMFSMGCGYTHHHPVITKVALISAGAVGGVAIHMATTHNCPNTYDGKPYQGTPPCPK